MLVAEPVLQLWLLDTESAPVSGTGAAWAGGGAQVTGLGGRGIAEGRPAETRDSSRDSMWGKGDTRNTESLKRSYGGLSTDSAYCHSGISTMRPSKSGQTLQSAKEHTCLVTYPASGGKLIDAIQVAGTNGTQVQGCYSNLLCTQNSVCCLSGKHRWRSHISPAAGLGGLGIAEGFGPSYSGFMPP